MLILTRITDGSPVYVNMDRVTYMEVYAPTGGTVINFGEHSEGYECVTVKENIYDIGVECDD